MKARIFLILFFFNSICYAQTTEKYDSILFSKGLAAVQLNGKWGYMDENKKWVVPAIYDKVAHFYNRFAMVSIGSRIGLINNRGEEVVKPAYDWIYYMNKNPDFISLGVDFMEDEENDSEYVKTYLNEKYGIIHKPTGTVILPNEYKEIHFFSDKLFKVKVNQNYGLYDIKGKEILPPVYDNIDSFSDGVARVRLGIKYGLINEEGKIVVQPKYDYMGNFEKGICQVYVWLRDMSLIKYSILDKKGNEYETTEEAIKAGVVK